MPAQYVVIDGHRMPALLGGHPALEFCNTYVGWLGGETSDYLASFDHLALWTTHVGLLDGDRAAAVRRQARRNRAESTGVLDRALRLRTPLYRLCQAAGEAGDLDVVNTEIRKTGPFLRLQQNGRGVAWRVSPAAGVLAPLVALTWSSAAFLTSEEQQYVHACPGSGCGWLFLDRRGRRRWCAMATCGNRAKARRYAERDRAGR